MSKSKPLKIVIAGLSLTSSWGNGHATTYRSLVRELADLGHEILFLERDLPWYASNRDLPEPPYGRTEIYSTVDEFKSRFTNEIQSADFVMLGSYVPQGVDVGEWILKNARGVTAFYDIDTPVTLAKLRKHDDEYLSVDLIPRFDLYLSFTGGPTLEVLEKQYGAAAARPLYCSVDPNIYYPLNDVDKQWHLGYMGTYSDDRQRVLASLMLEPATQWDDGRFVVAGPQYPLTVRWPGNVEYIEHLPPDKHCLFYNQQRFTLNVTRALMVQAGYSPSVRLFEAAACATPIISDYWDGLETLFDPGAEILISHGPEDTLQYLCEISDSERESIGQKARARVLAEHTAAHRARELEDTIYQVQAGCLT